jgi:lipopolysaccharide/colanic/teichoic acid biosynthesis glycosyltransferase/glycosyltransferase involved in cell wall biosynthesis
MQNSKIIRTSTVPLSLNVLLKGQLAFLNSHYKVVAVSGTGKDLEEVAVREQVATHIVEMERKISPVKDLISLWNLYWLFRKEKPAIVHSITPKAGLLSMTAAYFARVPVRVHTFTGLIFPTRTGLMQRVLIAMDRLLCFFATNIYPEGQGVRKDLIRYKITQKPLSILANGNVNGIDTAYFNSENFTTVENQSLRISLGINPNDFVFVFVGRLVGDKGINELVAAFKKMQGEEWEDERLLQASSAPAGLNAKSSSSKLLLVGPLETELDPLEAVTLKEISENPGIISVGFQPDVRPYLAISNCLAFPSYREGFPNVVMQAGSMGLPSIVSDINGCNEIILEGKNGTIIPVKDSGSLYRAMESVRTEKNLFNQLRQNARSMIVSRYQKDLVWDAILAEYRRLSVSLPIEETTLQPQLYPSFLKRSFDLIGAAGGLLVLSPIFLLVTLGLSYANKGNPFFFQVRPGRNGKNFSIVKFKTMNDQTDQAGNLLSDDARLTKLGSLVRRTSLDELPQLINVLKGEMSLIGPRPLLPEYLPLYNEVQRRRHNVTPGITGWAQVNGRNAISWRKKFEYDVWYVDNISFLLDLKILFITLKKVLVQEGVSSETSMTMERFSGN